MENIQVQSSDNSFIFAYGTLMKGLGNHRLLEGQKFIANAITSEKYAMFFSAVPFVNPNYSRNHILGEVWEVSPEALILLDKLEGHPDWYVRTPIKVNYSNGETGPEIAEIYFNRVISDEDKELDV